MPHKSINIKTRLSSIESQPKIVDVVVFVIVGLVVVGLVVVGLIVVFVFVVATIGLHL